MEEVGQPGQRLLTVVQFIFPDNVRIMCLYCNVMYANKLESAKLHAH
jgi:hypothetical protein